MIAQPGTRTQAKGLASACPATRCNSQGRDVASSASPLAVKQSSRTRCSVIGDRRCRRGRAVGFRYLILGFTYLFTGHRDYSAEGRSYYGFDRSISWWFILVAPIFGGLLYGLLVSRFAREARGHGAPEVMLAVAERGGRIRPGVALVKSLASTLCIESTSTSSAVTASSASSSGR